MPNTMLDWEGVLASTIFLPGCNFRCPYCQNPDLVLHPKALQTVSLSVIEQAIAESDGWVEGVCITGGEPCMHKGIGDLCEELRKLGVKVKLDTNGSFPQVLEELVFGKFVDYVAMDIKAPLEESRYKISTGVSGGGIVEKVKRSIEIVQDSGVDHEFRTTVVPMIHSPEHIGKIAGFLEGEKRYFLQYFSPRETLDPRFTKLKPFTSEQMEEFAREARKSVPEVTVRGAPAGMSQ
ncbi:MAG: anaerobic ribonucleoside-triphosphate reductase activating protein [Actinomycetota bacterium]|nr:anaerobic ribonucleoside-triphosphate reductase activating protein [Actinomycetota bacterium]